MAEGLERRFAALGVGLLLPERAFEALALVLERGRGGCVAVLNNDWPQLAAQLGHRQASVLQPLLQPLLQEVGGAPGEGAKGQAWQAQQVLRRQLADLDAEQARAVVVRELRRRLAAVMGLADAGSLDPGDSLFQLGLDSLMAVEWAAGIQRDLGVKLELESLAGDPTLEVLAAVVLEGLGDSDGAGPEGAGPEGGERSLDLGQEAQLRSSWSLLVAPAGTSDSVARSPEIDSPGEAIVLTGASGFLGAYLLAGQLQRWPQLQVRCLVRAQDAPTGLERIEANLGHYGLWQEAWASRLVAVPVPQVLLDLLASQEKHNTNL
jgi:aryl carrier-like protein